MNQAFTARAQTAMRKGGWTMYSSADLLQNGQVVVPGFQLDQDSAEVQVDGSAVVRRRFSGGVPNPTAYLPITSTGLLSPFKTEIRIWSGMWFPDGTYDRWAIFTGQLEDPQVTDTAENVEMAITASDRAQTVADRRLPRPVTFTAGTLVVDAIKSLILRAFPLAEFVVSTFTNNPVLGDITIDELEDGMQHADEFAKGAGGEVFADGMGRFVIRPVPNPDTQPVVWTFEEGAQAILKGVNQTLTAQDSYSHAITVSNPTDGTAPLRADHYDLEPDSPTYFDPAATTPSSFGDRPTKFQSDFMKTQEQVNAANISLLNRKRRAVSNVSITSAPLTALDEFDAVGVTRGRLSISSAFLAQAFKLPCSPGGEMDITTRSRRV